jgi:FAD:protein FMN transferase
MRQVEFHAMGCKMLAAIDSDDARADQALTQVPGWFADWESRLSRFRDGSELSQSNHANGKWFPVSEMLWQVIHVALAAARTSDGLITPTVLDALKAAGYDRSFDAMQASSSEGVAAIALVGDWRAIELDAGKRMVRLPRGMHLDFGGTAKGWAADQAVRKLSEFAPALVDAGGDIAISGVPADGEPWPIAIADPRDPKSDLAWLMTEAGGVATSGRDYRRWQRNGKWLHHIIDPRTGVPAETDVLSATVVAPTACEAEVAAKVVLILGSCAGIEWIEARESLAALVVLEDGTVRHSSRIGKYLWRESAIGG